MIEPCAVADACLALLGYALYADMKVSEVAALYGADSAALLAVNSLDFASPGAANRIHPAGLALRVPTRSACADAVRNSVSIRYAARPADTLASVADVVFAGLAAEDPDAPLDPGQTLVVPLRCVCFNSTDNNLPIVSCGLGTRCNLSPRATPPPLRISATRTPSEASLWHPAISSQVAITLPSKIISHWTAVWYQLSMLESIIVAIIENRMSLCNTRPTSVKPVWPMQSGDGIRLFV